jgi:hypothetical protein
MCGPQEKHAVGITHHQHSLEESENHMTKGTPQLRRKVSAACASHRDITKSIKFAPPQQTKERTRSTPRDTTHAHTHARTHTPPKDQVIDVLYNQVHRKHDAIRTLFHCFGINFNSQIDFLLQPWCLLCFKILLVYSCINHERF